MAVGVVQLWVYGMVSGNVQKRKRASIIGRRRGRVEMYTLLSIGIKIAPLSVEGCWLVQAGVATQWRQAGQAHEG